MTDLNNTLTLFIDFSVIAVLIVGIWQFRAPRGAKFGNLTAAFALLCAFVLVLYRNGIIDTQTVVLSLVAGSIAGYGVARAVNMIQIPSMVAFQHGAGGIAAFLVSLVELMRGAHALNLINEVSGILGLTIGSLTFSGSMIASAKLANKMRQTPQILPAHHYLVLANIAGLLVVGFSALYVPVGAKVYLYGVQIVLAALFGILFSIRIGGADMPVLISFLNATAGLAASFCGMVIENQLLIAFGATVAASGSILTHVMCKAMNRNLFNIFVPRTEKAVTTPKETTDAGSDEPGQAVATDSRQTDIDNDFEKAANIVADARNVIIVPGYGMALAQSQITVVALAKKMIAMGKDVRYAIHPVAGRMPGHMNVLLAEAGVDYDALVEMDDINPKFKTTDLVLVIGACDVVNPAAIEVPGTPISGMPILLTHEAKNVVCCNFDDKPGYSGVENPLYKKSNTVMLAGDAKETVQQLLDSLADETPEKDATATGDNAGDLTADAAGALATAKKVVIIPGYGMALAQAQFKAVELASLLEKRGADVKFAIHPVAGRMPGHMNVILAEAEVEYENLLEMDIANPQFGETDVAIVMGACDVVNPAAIETEGTPISGMPILTAQEAKKVIVCNFDEKPGYSGVENPLYEKSNTIMLLGDAKKTVQQLLDALTDETPEKETTATGIDAGDLTADAVKALASAKKMVIIPGYGMALAQAQFKVVELASLLEKNGASVKYAIHPVAGRMPGHMNVMLAEAEVEYENLLEMDIANPQFGETDVVLVFGACDVVNPAAIETEGTPISGMPILTAHEAKKIIVCNFDKKPGYSGVENPLYDNPKTILLLGDAKETASHLIASLGSLQN